MTITLTHSTPADGTFSADGVAAWNASHSLTGATSGGIVFGAADGSLAQDAGLSFAAGRVTAGVFTASDAASTSVFNGPISCPVGTADERFGAGSAIGATGGKNTAIGNAAVIGTQGGGTENVVVGANSSISSFTSFNTVLGADNSYTGSGNSVVIGNGVTNSSGNSVSIGTILTISGNNAGAIGRGMINSSTGGMGLGKSTPNVPNYRLMHGWADSVAATGIGFVQSGCTSAFVGRAMWEVACDWITSTDASRKARARFYVYDTATREFMQAEASGSVVKLAFFGSTAVVQPATTGTTTGFTAGAGTAVNDASTFTGNTGTAAYTIGDIVLALKQLGLMAA